MEPRSKLGLSASHKTKVLYGHTDPWLPSPPPPTTLSGTGFGQRKKTAKKRVTPSPGCKASSKGYVVNGVEANEKSRSTRMDAPLLSWSSTSTTKAVSALKPGLKHE